MENRSIAGWIGLGFAVFVGLIILFGSVGIVETGEVGVKTRNGRVVGEVPTGLYFKFPLIDTVYKIDVRTRVIKNEHYVNEEGKVISDNALNSASQDLQDVKVSVVVNYQIDPTKAVSIFTQYKTVENFEEGVVKPIIKQVVKETTAKYTAAELVTERGEYNSLTADELRRGLAEKPIILQDNSVTNVDFSPLFSQAIERKVTAEQDAIAAKNRVEQANYEAQAIRIRSEAANNEKYIQLQALEVQKEAIAKWNGVLPTQMVPGSALPFINLTK